MNDWNALLEQDATAFTNAAVRFAFSGSCIFSIFSICAILTHGWSYRVGEWDTHLRNNQADITALADQVQRLLLAQEELRRTMVRRKTVIYIYIYTICYQCSLLACFIARVR